MVNDNDFVLMRHKSNGVVTSYPRHYLEHPVFGDDLELYDPEDDEYEEDKVVVAGNELPVDQRTVIVAKPLDEFTLVELQDIARDRGLQTSGSKDELRERIEDNEEESN